MRAVPLPVETILPLIEVVQDGPNPAKKDSVVKEPKRKREAADDWWPLHAESLKALGRPVIVDFPTGINPVGTTTEIRSFLEKARGDAAARLSLYDRLAGVENLIPVATYVPETYDAESIRLGARILARFPRIAYRLFRDSIDDAAAEVAKVVRTSDIVLLDIGEAPYASPALTQAYKSMADLAKKGCTTVIIRSAIPRSLTNMSLKQAQQITEADNGLRDHHVEYGFHAWGDYAGIRADLPHTGGPTEKSPSPGFIFYDWETNTYIGFKGVQGDWGSFSGALLTAVMGSHYIQASLKRHTECPGCVALAAMGRGDAKCGNYVPWKVAALEHYLYTMAERLK